MDRWKEYHVLKSDDYYEELLEILEKIQGLTRMRLEIIRWLEK